MEQKPKDVESLRHALGKERVVRLFHTRPVIDDRWVKGVPFGDLKKYLVVRYPKEADCLLPEWNEDYQGKKVVWWDAVTHNEIKKSIKGYSDNLSREEKDILKDKPARKLFQENGMERFHTDIFDYAQQKYIAWCAEEGIEEHKMNLNDIKG